MRPPGRDTDSNTLLGILCIKMLESDQAARVCWLVIFSSFGRCHFVTFSRDDVEATSHIIVKSGRIFAAAESIPNRVKRERCYAATMLNFAIGPPQPTLVDSIHHSPKTGLLSHSRHLLLLHLWRQQPVHPYSICAFGSVPNTNINIKIQRANASTQLDSRNFICSAFLHAHIPQSMIRQ